MKIKDVELLLPYSVSFVSSSFHCHRYLAASRFSTVLFRLVYSSRLDAVVLMHLWSSSPIIAMTSNLLHLLFCRNLKELPASSQCLSTLSNSTKPPGLRRGRDSNPRTLLRANGFQDRRNRPLCHLSKLFPSNTF